MTRTDAEPRLSSAYWRLWWAAGIDNIGDGAFAAAVPLLAVTITRDSRLVSVVSAATYLPWLLLSLPAGALVDRHDRAGLMWRAQTLQAVIAGVVAILAAFGHVGVTTLAITAFGLAPAMSSSATRRRRSCRTSSRNPCCTRRTAISRPSP